MQKEILTSLTKEELNLLKQIEYDFEVSRNMKFEFSYEGFLFIYTKLKAEKENYSIEEIGYFDLMKIYEKQLNLTAKVIKKFEDENFIKKHSEQRETKKAKMDKTKSNHKNKAELNKEIDNEMLILRFIRKIQDIYMGITYKELGQKLQISKSTAYRRFNNLKFLKELKSKLDESISLIEKDYNSDQMHDKYIHLKDWIKEIEIKKSNINKKSEVKKSNKELKTVELKDNIIY